VKIAVEQASKSTKPTSAKTAMVRKSLRRKKFLRLALIRVLLMVKNTFSMENLMSIQIKKQEML
jgi:hypothetical protein